MQAIMETLFDILYLSTVVIIGIMMLKNSHGRLQYRFFGLAAILLGLGDSFHLIPRAVALCTTGLAQYTAALGIGKFITSITMTIFYVLLYYVWRHRYQVMGKQTLTVWVYVLAALRVMLCFMPQNAWTSATPPLSWGIYRNLPFVVLGVIVLVLFYQSAKGATDPAFRFLWLTILLSFLCYIPVVLFAETLPAVGILMIPKTCAYAWAVLIGYFAMKKETIS
ncbi:MAG: hypothetical protein RR053_06605 [Evtepia sp.]